MFHRHGDIEAGAVARRDNLANFIYRDGQITAHARWERGALHIADDPHDEQLQKFRRLIVGTHSGKRSR